MRRRETGLASVSGHLASVFAALGLAVAPACTSDGIAIYDSPPSSSIIYPSDGTQVSGVVTFEGQVEDSQDLAEDLTVFWKSSLDGTLFEGNPDSDGRTTLPVSSLTYGSHALTLQVVDSDAQSHSATIAIVYVPAAPRVEILNPATGASFVVGEPIEFRGEVEGADGERVLEVRWTSNLDGTFGPGVSDSDGVTAYTHSNLSPGQHTITLTGTVSGDGWSVQSQALIAIEVTELPEGDQDQDGDGFTPNQGDCNDHDASVYPGAQDVCDGLDNDCNGVVDDGFDGDGDGWSYCNGDCDDSDPFVNPGVLEDCDGYDEDCDGVVDNGWDLDGDLWTVCAGDCDDTEPTVKPGAFESCDTLDNDCDGYVDEGYDLDGDGFASCGGDCVDTDAAIHPGAAEVCGDGADNDCDGLYDDGFDADGDGYSTCAGDCDDTYPNVNPGAVEACDLRDNDCDSLVDEGHDLDFDGWSTCAGDCNDGSGAIYPGRTELCDGVDQDCDGDVDEGFDLDGDGYTSCGGDCNDGSASVRPGATEVCDGLDNDCDGWTDEGYDADGDGWASCAGDCDDGDATVYPGRAEVCDAYDQDCDGEINDGYEGTSEPASEVDWETDWYDAGDIEGEWSVFFSCTSPSDTCFSITIDFLSVNYCYDTQTKSGRFHSPDDTFDAFFFEYEPAVEIFDYGLTPCGVSATVSGIPSGHDYAAKLYYREDSWDSWTQVDFSDASGSSSESLSYGGAPYELDGQYLLLVESKGYWKCSGSSDYTVTIKGA